MTASLGTFVAAVMLAGGLACKQADQHVVGLLYIPRGSVPPPEQAQVRRAVHRLALERFKGSPDTVRGKVFAFGLTGAASQARRYLLVLPYGDRESSFVNDTASFYVITLTGEGAAVSQKYTIPLGSGRMLAMVKVAGLGGDSVPEVRGCVAGVRGRTSVFALTFANGALKPQPSPRLRREDCPQLEQP
jgi:hypothetical protein